MQYDSKSLDRYITGNYGEDQFKNREALCCFCDGYVDINENNMHPDSLDIPNQGEYTVAHYGCEYKEGAPEFDGRAWITVK